MTIKDIHIVLNMKNPFVTPEDVYLRVLFLPTWEELLKHHRREKVSLI